MFSTISTIAVSLTATAALVEAVVTQDLAVAAELREIRMLERAGELAPYEAQLLRDSAHGDRDSRLARWTTVQQTGPVTTLDLEAWHGRRDDEVLAIRADLHASGLL